MVFACYLINVKDSILAALEKIDYNKKGFLLVVDHEGVFLGTLTEGHIRRALIKGVGTDEALEQIYHKGLEKVFRQDDVSKVVELFQNSQIKFLPIIDENNKPKNVITKADMHMLLLADIKFDLDYDFINLDSSSLEHEICNRPWGFYKTIFLNEYSKSKLIKVDPGGVLSLQEHKKREEYWVVINGLGKATVGESVRKVKVGDFVYIPKGCKHRLENISDTESLMVSEVQLGDYFGEDDIIRYEDIYGRE